MYGDPLHSIILLSGKEVIHRLNRLAFQIYEDNFREDELILAGIIGNGLSLARELEKRLKTISEIKITLATVTLQKHQPAGNYNPELSIPASNLTGKVIVLVDDVIDSGKTMMYALRPFLEANIKKIRTVVLVDRDHKSFPVAADFAGLSLSTTLKERVTVEITAEEITARLA